jgi:dihydrofolate synthase/folylpolyglutamate synthase
MTGTYQGENIALTIATLETLQMNGVFITDNSIIEGFENTIIPGRMELVGFKPMILLDGAHNIAGINSLRTTLEEDFVYENLILIIGILSDKNIKDILEIIVPIADKIVTTKSQKSVRAFNPLKLKEMIGKKEVVVKDKIYDAIEYAKTIAKNNDLILITGSLYTVGEARDYFF